jgi:hypothetical protein
VKREAIKDKKKCRVKREGNLLSFQVAFNIGKTAEVILIIPLFF